ncbi:putative disease resistance protein RGA3 [Morella rubra]|uniref:Putative disease resistance protein RGA3 n=1 Tax=Morella rubra TaxID=262757 RepID=A0A6A1VTA2_9ROSI|nr:putative disease resistance protein RGA3 [Morella rubra]
MAEAFLFNIAGSVVKQASGSLGSQVLKELGLLWGIKGELEKLQNTVSAIQAVLLDAEEKQAAGENAVRHWLARLEDVVYEADDLLDDFSTEGLLREMMTRDKKAKKVRLFFSKSNQLYYGLKMGHKIKAIREKLDAIAADRQFRLENRTEEKIGVSSCEERDSHSFVLAEEVFSREDDKEKLTGLLLMESNLRDNVAILSIVGVGGLGKTTLAQLLFNDNKIQNHFCSKCGIFPKDCVISKSMLINLWIAQGFIKSSGQNRCLEDVGDKYFMDLLWRSFFQEAQTDEFGNIVGCKMHDVMHDLAVKVSGSSFTTFDSENTLLDETKIRHATIKDINFYYAVPTLFSKASRMQTLYFHPETAGFTESTLKANFSSLKLLRMLDLQRRSNHVVPSSISKLKHLRYLGLSERKILVTCWSIYDVDSCKMMIQSSAWNYMGFASQEHPLPAIVLKLALSAINCPEVGGHTENEDFLLKFL